MEEGQALRARGDGVVDRPLGRGVAPVHALRVLVHRVLCVVDDEVRPGEPLHVPSVLSVYGRPAPYTGGAGTVSSVRLMVHRVHNDSAVRLEPVAEGERWMVEVARDDAHLADLEAALLEIVESDRRATLRECDGEVGVFHLPGQRRLELLAEAAGRIDIPLVITVEERREEGEPLDVVPVRVRDQEVTPDGLRRRRG